MKPPYPDRASRLAGEYVLGLMRGSARGRFERLLTRDQAVQQAVAYWETRLAPLDLATPPVPPPPSLWFAIEERLDQQANVLTFAPRPLAQMRVGVTQGRTDSRSAVASGAPRPRDPASRWRWVSGALAACLVLVTGTLGWQVLDRTTGPPAAVGERAGAVLAVIEDKAGQPAWLVRTTADARLVAERLGPGGGPEAGTYELWYAGPGVSQPQPLGTLPNQGQAPLGLPPGVAATHPVGGTLLVSVEPQPAQPGGLPAGPVLFQGAVLPQGA